MNRVFISYAYEDVGLAMMLMEALGKVGVPAFLDRNELVAGENLSESVRNAIRSASAMVVLISSNTKHNNWMLFEVGVAQALDVSVIPVIFAGASVDQLLPANISDFVILNANTLSVEQIAEKLKALLS
jgi:hypothetical protein